MQVRAHVHASAIIWLITCDAMPCPFPIGTTPSLFLTSYFTWRAQIGVLYPNPIPTRHMVTQGNFLKTGWTGSGGWAGGREQLNECKLCYTADSYVVSSCYSVKPKNTKVTVSQASYTQQPDFPSQIDWGSLQPAAGQTSWRPPLSQLTLFNCIKPHPGYESAKLLISNR